MAHTQALNSRLWHGQATVDAVRDLLAAGEPATIELPETYHNSILAHLLPDEDPLARPESIERSGGSELMAQLAGVSGLECLADLVEPIRHAGADVRISSPNPTLTLEFSDRS